MIAVMLTFCVGITSFAATIPNPPSPIKYVNDLASVINAQMENQIESKLVRLYNELGVEFVVLTVDDIQGYYIEKYALDVFQKWGIGGSEKDNGLLLVISVNSRELRFEVGYGLEGDLPDAYCGRVIDEIIAPAFQRGNYGEGIYDAVMEVGGRLGAFEGEYTPLPEEDEFSDAMAMVVSVIIFIAIISLSAIFRGPRGPRTPRSGGWTSGGFGGGSFGGGGGFGGGSSSGRGSFGGGSSGGGGASGRW